MKKNKKIIIKLVAATLFSYGFMIIMRLAHNVNPFGVQTMVFGTTNLLSVLSIAYLFNKILDSNSKKTVAQLKKRLIPSFILVLLATVFIAISLYFLGNYMFYLINGDMSNFMGQTGVFEAITSLPKDAILSLLVGLFGCCIVFFYTTWRQAIEREQKLREENLRYRYRTLKTQLNPHFLFNSLNTLSEIVYADAGKADSYIGKLSGIYRYILDNEETDLISLDKEIEFVRSYLELQKERDGNKIQAVIDVMNADKFRIIPVSLQLLVENALKHNSVSEEKPLEIRIYAEAGHVVVSNTIQRKNILSDSCGLGLSNLKERVKLITRKEMLVSQENSQFTVKLPLVEV
jgi:hypothetical protein